MTNLFCPDLHLHSTASDGVLSPTALIARAGDMGATLIALTDHDTVAGLPEAERAAQDKGIAFLPGVEISAGGDAEVHILGYGVREDMPLLTALLKDMRAERRERALGMLERLARLGMPLNKAELDSKERASNGRAHIARMLVHGGYVADMPEAFDRFIGTGRPAYIPRRKLPVSDVVELLQKSGAVPVLAHPGLLKMEQERLTALLDQWIEAGLAGLEVYHPAHLPSAFTKWRQVANQRRLLVTGGSDFHDTDGGHADIGKLLPYWPDPEPCARALLSAVNEIQSKG